MLCKTVRILVISFSISSFFAATSVAQFVPGGVSARSGAIAGTGTKTLKLKPELVRMSVQISAKAKTLKEALENLKDQREAAILQLEQLGAEKTSILTTPPTPQVGQTDREKQMRRMLLQQQRAQGRKVGKGLKIPKSVTVSMVLTAEWTLPSDDQARILLFVNDIREKVVAADLAGVNKPEKKSPEEEELAEELAGMMGGFSSYDNEQSKPGEPQFFYVGRITEEQHAQLLTAAFQKAKAQAERLAAAAGKKLGKLVSLSGAAMQGDSAMAQYNYGRYSMRMALARQAREQGGDKKDNEALGANLDSLAFSIHVQAAFALANSE